MSLIKVAALHFEIFLWILWEKCVSENVAPSILLVLWKIYSRWTLWLSPIAFYQIVDRINLFISFFLEPIYGSLDSSSLSIILHEWNFLRIQSKTIWASFIEICETHSCFIMNGTNGKYGRYYLRIRVIHHNNIHIEYIINLYYNL